MTMATFDPPAPTHLRLMAQLGPRVGEQMMGKSQTHADALHTHLTGNGRHSTHSAVPSNPQKVIASSTKDETLVGADHRRAPDTEAERAGMRRKATLEASGVPSTIGKNAGAFDKLRRQVREHIAEHGELTKTVPHTPGHYSVEQAYADLKSVPLPSTAGSLKAFQKSLAKTARNLGNATLAKSLEAGYDSNSATLTGGSALRAQSLSRRVASTTVGGDPKPAPKPPILTKSQVRTAAMRGLSTGKLTASQCQHLDVALSMDRCIDAATMATIRALHGSK